MVGQGLFKETGGLYPRLTPATAPPAWRGCMDSCDWKHQGPGSVKWPGLCAEPCAQEDPTMARSCPFPAHRAQSYSQEDSCPEPDHAQRGIWDPESLAQQPCVDFFTRSVLQGADVPLSVHLWVAMEKFEWRSGGEGSLDMRARCHIHAQEAPCDTGGSPAGRKRREFAANGVPICPHGPGPSYVRVKCSSRVCWL